MREVAGSVWPQGLPGGRRIIRAAVCDRGSEVKEVKEEKDRVEDALNATPLRRFRGRHSYAQAAVAPSRCCAAKRPSRSITIFRRGRPGINIVLEGAGKLRSARGGIGREECPASKARWRSSARSLRKTMTETFGIRCGADRREYFALWSPKRHSSIGQGWYARAAGCSVLAGTAGLTTEAIGRPYLYLRRSRAPADCAGRRWRWEWNGRHAASRGHDRKSWENRFSEKIFMLNQKKIRGGMTIRRKVSLTQGKKVIPRLRAAPLYPTLANREGPPPGAAFFFGRSVPRVC